MEQILSTKQALLVFALAGVWTLMLIMAIYYFHLQLPFSPEVLIHGGIIIIIVLFIQLQHSTKSNVQTNYDSRISIGTPSIIVISLLTGLMLWLLDYANSIFILRSNLELQAEELLQMATRNGFISTSISVCLLAPLAEEMLFRGVLLPSLAQNISPRVAILITSLLFSLIHFSMAAALILFVAGLCFACLRVISNNIWPAFLAHCTNNTLTWSAYIMGWDSLLLS